MSIVDIKNLSLSFGDKIIFEGANFFVNKGDKMGLVGVNGAGKSTLIKILSGKVLVDKGDIFLHPKSTFGYLDQYAEIKSEKSIRNYLREAFAFLFDADKKLIDIYEKIGGTSDEEEVQRLVEQSEKLLEFLDANNFYAVDPLIEKVSSGLGVTDFGLDSPVANLSGGQRAKVMLTKLLLEKPDVILLDEPTNFLDVSHIDWLEKHIVSFEGTVVVVSHDEKFLKVITNCVCDVDNQKITRYSVGYDQYLKDKELRKEQHQKSYVAQQKEIARLEEFVAKNIARASTARMAQSRQKVLEKMEKIDRPAQKQKPTFMFKYRPLGSKILLDVTDLSVGYEKPILPPISIELERGEKLAITGFNGIGKSTFLKTLAGIIPALNGNFKFATNVIIGYYQQDNAFYDGNLTPLEHILSEFPKLTEKEARAVLSRCGLTSQNISESLSRLSGGEQSKVKLCYLSLFPCNVLILDEPTNHLDYLALEQLETAIKSFDGTVLFVSHDKEFVKRVADRELNMEKLFLSQNR